MATLAEGLGQLEGTYIASVQVGWGGPGSSTTGWWDSSALGSAGCLHDHGTSWEASDGNGAHSPAWAVLSALVFSSSTHLLISLAHESLPPQSPLPSPIPSLRLYFMMRDFGEKTH